MNGKQTSFEAILKKKGIGQTMSKTLNEADCHALQSLFQSDQVSLTSKATLVTAILTLAQSEIEACWWKTAQNDCVPNTLHPLWKKTETDTPFIQLIQRVIGHDNLNESEFRQCLDFMFDPNIDEWQKAAFLEAERLKGESREENRACYDYFWEKARRQTVQVPVLIDIANPYDGFTRHPNLSPFIAALLASIGFPCLIHGIKEVAPKRGVTPHALLSAAQKNPLQTLDEIQSDIENPDIGWGYCDQTQSFPELAALKGLRDRMVKRPVLATIEKLLQPIQASGGNHLLTGYTHPPYKEKMKNLLAHPDRCAQYLIIRGIEGATQVSIEKRARVINKDTEEQFVSHQDYFNEGKKAHLIPPTIKDTLVFGIRCLSNKIPDNENPCLYNTLLILDQLSLIEKNKGLKQLKTSIENGHALKHWEKKP